MKIFETKKRNYLWWLMVFCGHFLLWIIVYLQWFGGENGIFSANPLLLILTASLLTSLPLLFSNGIAKHISKILIAVFISYFVFSIVISDGDSGGGVIALFYIIPITIIFWLFGIHTLVTLKAKTTLEKRHSLIISSVLIIELILILLCINKFFIIQYLVKKLNDHPTNIEKIELCTSLEKEVSFSKAWDYDYFKKCVEQLN